MTLQNGLIHGGKAYLWADTAYIDTTTAKVAGHDILEKPAEVRRSIGYLSGETKLYDRLTGRELLEYFGTLASMSRPASPP